MADDKVAIWGNGLKFGRKTANGELLIGNGDGFTLATLTAGAGASITNSAGGIQISATGSGGTVTGVTASSPLSSSGGASPNISIGTVPVANGGTGQTSLTANNVILGNGTSAVQFVAPGTTGNILTSNGTTWTSAAAPQNWTLIKKTFDQTITSSVAYVDDNQLQFSVEANKSYSIRGLMWILYGSGGFALGINGPASPTRVRATTENGQSAAASYTAIYSALGTSQRGVVFNVAIQNGANAGTFAMRLAQASSNVAATTFEKGSWLEWTEIV